MYGNITLCMIIYIYRQTQVVKQSIHNSKNSQRILHSYTCDIFLLCLRVQKTLMLIKPMITGLQYNYRTLDTLSKKEKQQQKLHSAH